MTFKDDLLTDLDTFVDSDDFATEFVYTSLKKILDEDDLGILSETGGSILAEQGVATTITGVFDNAFEVVLKGIATTAPMVLVKDSDVVGIAKKDTFTNTDTSVVYYVVDMHPDGTGMTYVILSQN